MPARRLVVAGVSYLLEKERCSFIDVQADDFLDLEKRLYKL